MTECKDQGLTLDYIKYLYEAANGIGNAGATKDNADEFPNQRLLRVNGELLCVTFEKGETLQDFVDKYYPGKEIIYMSTAYE